VLIKVVETEGMTAGMTGEMTAGVVETEEVVEVVTAVAVEEEDNNMLICQYANMLMAAAKYK
jgi:hypothetical protein